MKEIVDLQRQLEAAANASTRQWWEKYLRGAIPFRGTKMAEIRGALHRWYDQAEIGQRSGTAQQELARDLLRETFAEDKLAGILFLQEILLPANAISWQADLEAYGTLFDEGYIYDWNTCDWFCVKFLGPLAQKEGEGCARAIAGWRTASNMWRRRAAGVAFVDLAKQGESFFPGFPQMLVEVCAATVAHPERFAQTGTGWVLRELSVAAPELVVDFLEAQVAFFSREAIRSAVKKLPSVEQERLLALHAHCQRKPI